MAGIIRAEALDETRFAPFGRILRLPRSGSAEPTIARDRVTLYGDLARIAIEDGEVEFGLAVLEAREPRMAEMEQHRHTAELLFAVRGAFVLPVAPPQDEEPASARVAAFVIPEGEGCVLHAATWHWAPFPMADRCEILVGFRAGTPRSDMVVRPMARGDVVEIGWAR